MPVMRPFTSLGWIWRSWKKSRRTPGLAMVVLGGLPPASWIPWQPWDLQPMDMASDMNMESSIRRSKMDGRWKRQMIGSDMETPGRRPDPSSCCPCTSMEK